MFSLRQYRVSMAVDEMIVGILDLLFRFLRHSLHSFEVANKSSIGPCFCEDIPGPLCRSRWKE